MERPLVILGTNEPLARVPLISASVPLVPFVFQFERCPFKERAVLMSAKSPLTEKARS